MELQGAIGPIARAFLLHLLKNTNARKETVRPRMRLARVQYSDEAVANKSKKPGQEELREERSEVSEL